LRADNESTSGGPHALGITSPEVVFGGYLRIYWTGSSDSRQGMVLLLGKVA